MKTRFVLAATALIIGTSVAVADPVNRLNVPRDQWLAPAQITEKLSAQGYKVLEIESDDGAYEVEMIKDGVRLDTHVHPATAEIMPGYDD